MSDLRKNFVLKLLNRVPGVTVREAIAPEEVEAKVPAEQRLLDRRCRCGALATETATGCGWHEATSAHYAATLLAVLKTAEALVPGTIVAAAQVAADDAELAAQPWFQEGLAAYREGRVRKA